MKQSKGFTIIELVVVTAVFLFIIGAAIGIFISVVQNQKKVLSEQQLLNQVSYVEEYMSKALRVAKKAEDSSCIPAGYIYLLRRQPSGTTYTGIKFINQTENNACQEFFLGADGILKEIKNGGSAVPITPSSIQISSARFSVNGRDGTVAGHGCSGNPDQCGALDSDPVQPRVTMVLKIGSAGESYTRTIQTTVSQRNLNVK